jgi:hypothetical protein
LGAKAQTSDDTYWFVKLQEKQTLTVILELNFFGIPITFMPNILEQYKLLMSAYFKVGFLKRSFA